MNLQHAVSELIVWCRTRSRLSWREWAWLGVLVTLVWWAWPQDGPAVAPQPEAAEGLHLALVLPPGPPEAPAATAPASAASEPGPAASAPLAQEAPSQRWVGITLTETPVELCKRWQQGNEDWPSGDQRRHDIQEASTRFWQGLMSSSDPVLQAIGLSAMEQYGPLMSLANASDDPRVVLVALAALVDYDRREERAHDQTYLPEVSEHPSEEEQLRLEDAMLAAPPYQPRPEPLAAARRWAELEPDNGAAWLAVGAMAFRLGQWADIDAAVARAAQASQYRSYMGLISAEIIQATPPDFNWWQRSALLHRLMDMDGVLDPFFVVLRCAPGQLSQRPELAPSCSRIAQMLTLQAKDSSEVVLGYWLEDQMRKPGALSLRAGAMMRMVDDQSTQWWRGGRTMTGCQQVARYQQRLLRQFRDGGDLAMIKESAAQGRRPAAASVLESAGW